MIFSKAHELPYEWKKTLVYCTDFATWLVFSDWLEEHEASEMARSVRWLVKNKKMPHGRLPTNKLGVIFFREYEPPELQGLAAAYTSVFGIPLSNNMFRWEYPHNVHTNDDNYVLPGVVHERLPGVWRLRVWHPNYPPQEPRVKYAKWTATILKSYLNAAKALHEEYQDWVGMKKTSVPGCLPNWLKDF